MLAQKLLGVIFDLDNTLVSSSLNFEEIRACLGCAKDIDLLDFVDALPTEQQAHANKLLVEFEVNDALNAKNLLGTEQLIALLSELDIPCAIVTRNCRQAALIKMKNNNIAITMLLTRADHKAKPAPDALLHLAQLWQAPAENLLYVGDYLYDLQAAQNANTMSCLVTHGETPDYANLANIVVNELTELSEVIRQIFAREATDVPG
ncbi:HAD family hydrolase [Colwellia sp. C1TZA3]|uniref:HAD family hydrolase n=1 Tax=Colwellia sp. C1TZA3 TaxID=2508879 RepID=UPI0011B9C721|nr:HAD-IA family hydrolase [Colwellia sp. C1TZA3]TWX69978.1 HAD family hydrolase [Colwellia sp. C1TZA3]